MDPNSSFSGSASGAPAPDAVERAVVGALRRVCEAEGFDLERLAASASLVHDVGMDSLVFVEVTVALEEDLGIIDFPLQAWADEEAPKQRGYTLASLVDYARRWVAASESRAAGTSAQR